MSRLAIVATGLLALLAAAYTAYLWGRYLVSIDVAGLVGERAGRDFRAFSVAGSLASVQDVNDLYNQSSLGYVTADAAAFVYPPWFAVMMIPFSFVSFQVGYWVWLGLTAALAAVSLWVLRGRLGLFALGILLAFAAGFQTVLYGQSAFLLLGFGAAMVWATASRRSVLAGVSVALMAFKPHMLLGLGVVWLWRWSRSRSSLLAAVVTSSVLYAMSEVLLPGSLVAWISALAGSSGDLVAPTAEITLGSVARLLVGDGFVGSVAVWALVAGGVIWVASVLHRKDLDTGTLLVAAFGMSIAVSLHALLYDVVVIIPALVLVWSRRTEVRTRMILFGVAAMSLLTVGPIAVAAQLRVLDRAVSIGPIALALFVVWLVESADPGGEGSDDTDVRIAEPAGT